MRPVATLGGRQAAPLQSIITITRCMIFEAGTKRGLKPLKTLEGVGKLTATPADPRSALPFSRPVQQFFT